MATYQGPVRPDTSEKEYRETGKTVKETKEDLYVNLDDINKPDGRVMTRDETGLDKPTTYSGGRRNRNRNEPNQTTQTTEEVEQPKPEIKPNRYQQERENYRQRQQELLESKQRYDTKVSTLKDFRNTSDYQKYKEQFKGNYSDVDVYNKYVEETNRKNLYANEKLGQGYSTKEGYVYLTPTTDETTKEKPLSVVTGTSRGKEYEEYIKDKNPVRAAKEYVIERVTGEISKTEKGQNLFGKPEVKTGLGLGLYFVPVLGQTLLVAEGVGQFTKAGRTEAKEVGEQVKQKTGLPSGVGEYGTFILAGAGAAGGVASGVSKVAAKTTKFDTTFIATTSQKAEGIITTESKAVTTESNLFFNKQYRTTIQTTTKTVPAADESTQVFISGSKGATAEVKPIRLPYVKTEYAKPKPFISAEVSVAQKGEEELTRVISVGKTQSYKEPVSYYANLGYAKQVDDLTYYVGRGRVLEKVEGKFKPTNKMGSRGIIRDVKEQTETFIIKDLQQAGKTSIPKSIIEQQQKSAIVSAIKSTKPEPSIFIRAPARKGIAAAAQEEKVIISTQPSQTQIQKADNRVMTIPNTIQQETQIVKTETKQVPQVIPNIKEKEIQRNKFIETAIPKDIVRTEERVATATMQRQNQLLLQKERQTLNNLYKPFPTKPIIKPLPLVLPSKNTSQSKESILSKFKTAYSVFIKRRGKEIEIGKALPLGKAKKLGITSVLSSLARSYRIKEAGTTTDEDIYYNEPLGVFRQSKVGVYRVQKSRFALSSSAERREIQMFKRQKSGRFKFL